MAVRSLGAVPFRAQSVGRGGSLSLQHEAQATDYCAEPGQSEQDKKGLFSWGYP